ncbi:MAG: hypothetical protein FJ241_11005 [Nitrospira sp.]|nr:hypothetical protein [Nitrospira sp.]
MEPHEMPDVCKEIFKNINEKLDGLVTRADKINGRYEKHMEESIYYRNRVERHDEKMKLLTWLFGILTIPVIILFVKELLLK